MKDGGMGKGRSGQPSAPTVLHVFDGFRLGGTEIRTCRIINYLGQNFKHVVLSNNGNFDASRHIAPEIDVRYLHPKLSANFQFCNFLKISKALKTIAADLMIAYEWGAIDWVLVNCLVPSCPMIMTVEGFEESELFVQKRKRQIVRRMLYSRCDKVAVCSKTLYSIATAQWKLSPPRLLHIPNGVDCRKFKPLFASRDHCGKVKLGIVASLIKLKDHIKLLRCFNEIPKSMNISLQVAGDGPELKNLKKFCRENGIDDAVQFLGHVDDTPSFLRQLDIFCLSSQTEQMPMVVLEAMAAGLPIISTDVGDVKYMVANENRSFIVEKDNDEAYVRALELLTEDEKLRKDIGSANRKKCVVDFDETLIFGKYKELYFSCIGTRR